ncbi:FixH family protein [Salicibibacter cibarius]|uniref:YtkA-like domain-containing protein n=2 Tax=Salicibibacter TaxID=2685905 RepID=A0A514LJD4_9BACI|nr:MULTISPECIES: FixH family protein [Salicibibacter]QDI91957.1 hypothetical protein EPH95_12860 [Salicibibacter halophilus]QQK74492.1 FixH family protein [Salicibibacter cibarius]
MPKRYLPIVVSFLLLAACNSTEEENPEEVSTEPIEVEILIDQEVEPNEQIEIQTKVTHEGEPVDDANDVQIEIRDEDQNENSDVTDEDHEGDEMYNENSDMIEADHEGDGIYSISYDFDQEGTYEIQSHVTARGMHNMPTESIVVTE